MHGTLFFIVKKCRTKKQVIIFQRNFKLNNLIRIARAKFPNKYMKIKKLDRLKREYRKMVIKNYVVLYTIDEENKKVYISHMYYGRRNYL